MFGVHDWAEVRRLYHREQLSKSAIARRLGMSRPTVMRLLELLKTAEWANTTIAAGDTAEEIDKLRRGRDGHIVVWGGVSLWRSLMRLDLIDELQLSLFPYVAGEGTRLFDGVPKSYRLDLVSSTASSNGIVELQYRRHR